MRRVPHLVGVLVVTMVAAAVEAAPLGPGPWLVDLGRDYPRSQQAGLSDADAEITLLLMEAASRVEPALAEPYLWQYDMLSALGREEAARRALGHYVERQPTNLAAHLSWVADAIDHLQTAEQRAEFCRQHLQQANVPPKVASDLHRRLAEFHLNRGEFDQATAEAGAAIEAYPLNFAARDLLKHVKPGKAGAADTEGVELRELLLRVTASPGDAALVLTAGDALSQAGLIEPAARMHVQAAALLTIADPHDLLPQALVDQADAVRSLGQVAEAAQLIAKASQRWKDILAAKPGERIDPEVLAEMAWFYAHYEPQPPEAERLARTVLAEAPNSVLARRALGAALRQQNRLDDAQRVLEPAATADAWAAIELAEVLKAGGGQEAAAKTLQAAATRPAGIGARHALRERMQAWELPVPTSQPASNEVRQAVEAFPWAVLDYPLHPDRYLALDMRMPADEMVVREPWVLTVQLKNIGSFPITLGEGLMVVPDLLLSVEAKGDRVRSTGPTLRISLNRTPLLAPGESVQMSQTIDIGPLRSGMIGTPQMDQQVTVNGVLSPVAYVGADGQEIWTPAIGGLLAKPLVFRRKAFVPTDEAMRGLYRAVMGEDVSARIHGLEVLSMLLAEHQHILAGRLKYSVRAIDPTTVQAAILARGADADWRVRARLAECMRWFVLDQAATREATKLLSDPHWLVRGLTMRALADHYGAKFAAGVLSKAAQQDPDEWVRRLAAALNERISLTATQPAVP